MGSHRHSKRYLLTGGGTGGHVTPNLAILTELRALNAEAEFLYLGKATGYEARVKKDRIPFRSIPCAPFVRPRSPKSLLRFLKMAALILAGTLKAGWIMACFRPDVVIASGGYVSVPTVLAARLLGRRIYVHEQNVHPGLANRFLAKLADRVGVSFAATAERFPKERTTLTGYPVRPQILTGDAEKAREALQIPKDSRVVFVMGGSMGSRAINRGLVEALPALLEIPNLSIVHCAGLSQSDAYHALNDTRKRIEQSGEHIQRSGRYICEAFFKDIQDLYALADIVVARAGAGTVMELATVGKACILIPKSDVPGNHQQHNAVALQKTGGALVVYEERNEEEGKSFIRVRGDNLANAIHSILEEEGGTLRKGEEARSLAVPDALARHVLLIDDLASGASRVRREVDEEAVGWLQLESGTRRELLFHRNTIGTGSRVDVRLPKSVDHCRALILRTREHRETHFHLLPQKGNWHIDGEAVTEATELKPGGKITVGDQRLGFDLTTESRELPKSRPTLGFQVLVTSFGTLVSRGSGFLRSAVMAALFGLGHITDLFVIGLTIANFLRGVFAEMAVDTAFLPNFIHLQKTGKTKEANRLLSTCLTGTLLLTVSLSVLLIVTLPLWLPFIPGLEERGLVGDAITVTGVMLPYLVMISVAAILSAVLKACNKFAVPAFSSVMFNVGILIGAFLYPVFGIVALGAGVLLGGLGQVLIQLPSYLSKDVQTGYGVRYRPMLALRDPAVKKVGRVTPNIVLDVAIQKLGSVVDVYLAMRLATGMVSALSWAMVVFHLPFGLISQSINTVVLKELSDRQASRSRESIGKLLVSGINWTVFSLLPLSVFMVILARPLVDLLFGFGQFSASNAETVALALRCYAIGLIGWGLTGLTTRFFAARMEQNRSTATSALALVLNIALSITLVNAGMGIAGLAIGTSVSFLFCALLRTSLLFHSLKQEQIPLRLNELRRSTKVTSVATAGAALAVLVSYQAISGFEEGPRFLSNLFRFLVPAMFGGFAYISCSRLLNSPQLEDLIRRFSRRRESPGSIDPAYVNPYCMQSATRVLNYVKRTPDSRYETQRLARRVAAFLKQPQWETRNIGVKLVGELQLKVYRLELLDIIQNRQPAPLSHRLLGGDFHEPGFVRRNAVTALTKLGEPDDGTLEVLIRFALSDPYYEVRAEAARVMKQFATHFPDGLRQEAVARLAELARERNFEVAQAAVIALGDISDTDEVVELYRSLHYHRNWKVRNGIVLGYEALWLRGVLTDQGRMLALLDDVLATSEGFVPHFQLKEDLARLQRSLLQSKEEKTQKPTPSSTKDLTPVQQSAKSDPKAAAATEDPGMQAEAHA